MCGCDQDSQRRAVRRRHSNPGRIIRVRRACRHPAAAARAVGPVHGDPAAGHRWDGPHLPRHDTQLGRDVVLKVLRARSRSRCNGCCARRGRRPAWSIRVSAGSTTVAASTVVRTGDAADRRCDARSSGRLDDAGGEGACGGGGGDALHAAHRAGLVHRDGQASNILAQANPDGGWTPYVVDFGLARSRRISGSRRRMRL